MDTLTQKCWLPLDGDQYHNGEHWPDRTPVYPYGVTSVGKVACLTLCGQVLLLQHSDIDHPLEGTPNGHSLRFLWARLWHGGLSRAYGTLPPEAVLASLDSVKPLSNTESLIVHPDMRYNTRVGYVVFNQIEPLRD